MVSEMFCLVCRGGSKGDLDLVGRDDPEAAREARIRSQKIDQEIRRDQRKMHREVRDSLEVLRTYILFLV